MKKTLTVMALLSVLITPAFGTQFLHTGEPRDGGLHCAISPRGEAITVWQALFAPTSTVNRKLRRAHLWLCSNEDLLLGAMVSPKGEVLCEIKGYWINSDHWYLESCGLIYNGAV